MKSLFLSLCFIFTILVAYSPESYGDFSFDIDSFTVDSGASTIVDEFDDDIEPPSGPSGPATYSVFATFSTDAESGGVLNMNSNDVFTIGNERFIDIWLQDIISPGIGGRIEGKFSFSNGITPNAAFRIEIISPIANGVSLFIEKSPSGIIYASVNSEGNGLGVTESQTDITSSLSGITNITLRLDVSNANIVTASLDYGSDTIFDVTLPGTGTLFGAADYWAGFGAEEDALQCGIEMSQAIYTAGDTVTAQAFRIANLGLDPISVEWKVWLGTPFTSPIPIVNIGADGTFVLPAGFDLDFGPLPLFPAAILPLGTYELSTRVLDPVTGELLCEDLNEFEIQ
ncbi:MAG: hypothetical protein K8F52_18175 [Candidatus Scalindua rubra]|uniref:Uncharacterized protein n=1 Tax=Candidatus Scalindua brodae TaxID=237368 RepID=A0A0B0EFQ7_9BACT|nr:MAG: hypothetical protein SCABRO_02822 [Candidatus Scalindua brodae]MBZ0110583.1 hypothetical protein [Candidatus Scalindua rubra]